MANEDTERDPREFYRRGSTTVFACEADQRFSYCLYVPTPDPTSPPPRVVTLVHGTERDNRRYRDLFVDFAEAHRCAVVAPLFPAGIDDPDDLHNYKFLAYHGIRYDLVLLSIVDEVAQRHRLDARRFLLHGFSGGGQFVHRFFYLHPDRLAAVSIGAPGRITRLDPDLPWWLGIRGMDEVFDTAVDVNALARVPVQMVVGAEDVETWEINNPGDSNWLPGVEQTGGTRVERLRTLQRDFSAQGINTRFDLVPGVAHDGVAVLDPVRDFFGDVLSQGATTAEVTP